MKTITLTQDELSAFNKWKLNADHDAYAADNMEKKEWEDLKSFFAKTTVQAERPKSCHNCVAFAVCRVREKQDELLKAMNPVLEDNVYLHVELPKFCAERCKSHRYIEE